MKYYAINYPCAFAVSANTGDRYGDYHSFDSIAERDAWIDEGGDFRSDRNYRERIAAKDPELRRVLRNRPESIIDASGRDM